jgi:hypothetical protein
MTAIERRKQLEQYRDWLHSHPHRVDADVKPAALDFISSSLAELDEPEIVPEQSKNAFPARKTPLRSTLINLLLSIVTQGRGIVKE